MKREEKKMLKGNVVRSQVEKNGCEDILFLFEEMKCMIKSKRKLERKGSLNTFEQN